jgi:putative endonuclease
MGPPTHYVYILRCSDDCLYVGSTTNLSARVRGHNDGHGAAYTFKRRPVALAYSEALPDRAAAIRRERQIKGRTRQKKEALVRGDLLYLD